MKPKPHIAYLLQMFGVGGMPKWLFRLAGRLTDEFRFTFVATHSAYVLPVYSQVARVAVVPPNKWRLAAFLFKEGIDLAQVANLRVYTDAARLAKVPSVIERVDGFRGGAAVNRKEGLDAVVASTHGIVPHLEQLTSPECIQVIYNGVDLEEFDHAIPERFGFGKDDVIIGRTSRLSGGKNISLLINAVIQLRLNPKYHHVRLVICGGDTTQPGAPPTLAALREEAEPLGDSVVFTGEVIDTTPITKGFDIATCTSLPNNEGIPNSVLEGMAAGKPVVASQVDDLPEVIHHGETGLLFPSEDLPALVEALMTLVDDRALRERMGIRGRTRIAADFNLDVQCEKYRKLYQELISKNGLHPLRQMGLVR